MSCWVENVLVVAARVSVYSNEAREVLGKGVDSGTGTGTRMPVRRKSVDFLQIVGGEMSIFFAFYGSCSLGSRQDLDVGNGCQEFTDSGAPRETLSKKFQCHRHDYTQRVGMPV